MYRDNKHRNGFQESRGRTELKVDPMRLPPQNIAAEQGLLGSILLDNSCLHDVVPILRAEDFYRDVHQTVYRVILSLYSANKAVDSITVVEELQRLGQFSAIGGHDAMAAILTSTPHAANAAHYAEIVHDKALLRSTIAAATQMLADCYSNQKSAKEVLAEAERSLFELTDQRSGANLRSMAEIMPNVIDGIERRQQGEFLGISSGFPTLDQTTGGFRPGQLVILAARPSMGKTAIAGAFAEHAAGVNKYRVLITSLEMSGESLAERMLASQANVNSWNIRTGYGLETPHIQRIGEADRRLREMPIYVDDTPAQDMLTILSTARRLKMRGGLGMVIVDYLQLVSPAESGRSRNEQVEEISRRLKAMARELQVPVIALAQLNRKCEDREDKRPVLSDLRDSGSIEQDADIVILLHRPDRYDPKDQPGLAELIVAKNREGKTETCPLTFLKDQTRFVPYSEQRDDRTDYGPAPECEEPFG